MSKLSDEELADVDKLGVRLNSAEIPHGEQARQRLGMLVVRAIAELRTLRLTDEERDALRWARSLVDEAYRAWHGPRSQYDRALAVLAKLTRGGGE